MSRPGSTAEALRGRVAIVTGGGRCLGADSSLALAGLGATVVVADRCGADETATRIRTAGGVALAADVDLLGKTDVERVVVTALEHFGRVDILVNAAGEVHEPVAQNWADVSDEAWNACFATQVTSVWLACRAVAPTMRQQKYGRIINVGSSAVMTGTPRHLPYVTAKSALLGITRSLARELGPANVAVNMIYPAPQPGEDSKPGPGAGTEAVVPRPSLGAGPSELDGALGFLCGDDAGFITGQSWVIDRGRVLQ